MRKMLRHWQRLLTLLVGLCALGGMSAPVATQAQDGPQCPPGFHFDRLSGVGCVQDNCMSISQAHYSYTGQCICNDGYKACYEPVEATSFDSSLCAPFCPGATLITCVSPEAACPGETLLGESQPVESQPPDETSGPDLSNLPEGVEGLLRDLEEFMVGEGHPISAERSAAAAAAASALLGTWVLTNLATGGNLNNLLQAVKAWLSGTRPGGGASPAQKPALAGHGVLPGEAKAPPLKEAGDQPAPQAGKSPPAQAGKSPPTPEANKAAAPGAAPAPTPPASAEGKHASLVPVDPAKLRALQERFREVVDIAVEQDVYVANRSIIEKAWNGSIGGVINFLRDKSGGTCGDFADWGRQWTQSFAEEIFGKGVVVDTIYIGERSSEQAQALVKGPIDWLDSWIEGNHAATRVILPNGESYVLDYWQAVGDRQQGLFEKGVNAAYGQIFGGKPNYPTPQIVPESAWIQKWSNRIGEAGDPAVVHNMHYAQGELQNYLANSKSEAEAFDRFRQARKPGVPPEQIETIINSYKKGGVWWGKQ